LKQGPNRAGALTRCTEGRPLQPNRSPASVRPGGRADGWLPTNRTGDQEIYGRRFVRIGRSPFSMRTRLVVTPGQNSDIDGYPPARDFPTPATPECRLHGWQRGCCGDIDADTVDFKAELRRGSGAAEGRKSLPARLPNPAAERISRENTRSGWRPTMPPHKPGGGGRGWTRWWRLIDEADDRAFDGRGDQDIQGQ